MTDIRDPLTQRPPEPAQQLRHARRPQRSVAKRRWDAENQPTGYRLDNGLCQMCLDEGRPEREARVSWSEYQADHVIPHTKGGPTAVWNAQVLCQYHNQLKGASL